MDGLESTTGITQITQITQGNESTIMIFLLIALIIFFIYMRQRHIKSSDNDTTHGSDSQDHMNEHFEKHKTPRTKQYYKKHHDKKNKLSKKQNKLDVDNLQAIIRNSMNDVSPNTLNINEVEIKNSDFIEIQYHKDYNDTITAINNLTSQKELFNLSFLPVKELTPNPENINDLVKLFIQKVNDEVSGNVSEYLHKNSGWNDMGKRQREKSGFEEQMETLGLPGSLHNEPAAKSTIKLINIEKTEQYVTDDQIRFVITLIVQKLNVKDQMVLKIYYLMDTKNDNESTDNFFNKSLLNKNDKKLNDHIVIIEQLWVVGYLTNDTMKKTKMDKFHDYNNVQRIDGTIDQEKVIKIMLQKHLERDNELNSFMCTVDSDTKEIHDITQFEDRIGPQKDTYNHSHGKFAKKNTRTIMDDLAKFPEHS